MRLLAFLSMAFMAVTCTVVSQTNPQNSPLKIGAYYYGGWWRGGHAVRERLTGEFSNREPVWGWYEDSPEIIKQQIDYAADAGISFWAFCWYYPEGDNKMSRNNDALNMYLQAPNKDRLQFCLLVANHRGSRIGLSDWKSVSIRWVELFKQSAYLKVNDRPVLIIFSPDELLKAFGTPDDIKAAFNRLRGEAIAAGLNGVSIGACATPGPENGWSDLAKLEACGFDFFTGYNYHFTPKAPPKEQSILKLIDGNVKVWDAFAKKNTLPYIPVVTTGWDMRPWEKKDLSIEKQSVFYSDRTPEMVEYAIRKGVQWLRDNPRSTFPENLLLLYAWNELGEGGYMTPGKVEGDAYLKTISRALQTP